MGERYVLTYIDLDKDDGVDAKYFDCETDAYRYLNYLKANQNIMSELVLSESRYEEFELINLDEDDYDD